MSAAMPREPALEAVRDCVVPLDTRTAAGLLVAAVGDAQLVLIGEATHGTDEFYRIRADLTKALTEQKAFDLVAMEADWPDAYRANRWVRLATDEVDASAALGGFMRFPRWMWRNDVVVEFLGWLREHNRPRPSADRAGSCGLDLDSLRTALNPLERWSLEEADLPETHRLGV